MDLSFSPEELAFRGEVREFLRSSLPDDIRRKMFSRSHLDKADLVRWHKILAAKGWVAPHWPTEWGGTDWSATQRYIFQEELLQWPAPEPISFNTTMIGPVLIAFGSDEQKRTWLPKILSADLWFCQGFSEPGSGSDLASLRTRAVRDGDHYVVNGQKMWTTAAHHADWIFALVRTDPAAKKQEGISFLLIDMKTPGVEVRPIRTIDGHHHTNEVFFTDVQVPVSNLVGEENHGWDYAKFLLGNERNGIARVGLAKGRLRHAKAVATQQRVRGGTLAEDRRYREQVGLVEIELKALEITAMRLLDAARRKEKGKPDPMSSILKIKGADVQQASTEILLKTIGPHAMPAQWDGNVEAGEMGHLNALAEGKAGMFFFSRAASIYGGSNEIQHNILSKAVLGL